MQISMNEAYLRLFADLGMSVHASMCDGIRIPPTFRGRSLEPSALATLRIM
jgi:hypothetical protein